MFMERHEGKIKGERWKKQEGTRLILEINLKGAKKI